MMKKLCLAFWISLVWVLPAQAAPTVDEIITMLKAQGYHEISVKRTWLGRTLIEATNDTHEREIVFNRRTGEILRDYWERLEDEDGAVEQGESEHDAESESDENELDDGSEESAGDETNDGDDATGGDDDD